LAAGGLAFETGNPRKDLPTGSAVSRGLSAGEIEDKPWFYSREFWQGYLDMLVAGRFNRFNFSLGIGLRFSARRDR
jgi:hypothetical protein